MANVIPIDLDADLNDDIGTGSEPNTGTEPYVCGL